MQTFQRLSWLSFTWFASRNGHIYHNMKVLTYSYAQRFMLLYHSFLDMYVFACFPVILLVKVCPLWASLRTSCLRGPCRQGSPPPNPGPKTGSATSITTVSHPACPLCLSLAPSLSLCSLTLLQNFKMLMVLTICCRFTTFHLFTFSTRAMLRSSLLLLLMKRWRACL